MEVHDEARVALDGDGVVEEGIVLGEHALAEGLDLGEEGRQCDATGLELPSIDPEDAHHLVDLEANQGEQHMGPATLGLGLRDRGGVVGGAEELAVVAVQG